MYAYKYICITIKNKNDEYRIKNISRWTGIEKPWF